MFTCRSTRVWGWSVFFLPGYLHGDYFLFFSLSFQKPRPLPPPVFNLRSPPPGFEANHIPRENPRSPVKTSDSTPTVKATAKESRLERLFAVARGSLALVTPPPSPCCVLFCDVKVFVVSVLVSRCETAKGWLPTLRQNYSTSRVGYRSHSLGES